MICLKSKFITLFLPACSNPKHQEELLVPVLTKWRDDLGTHRYSPSPRMTISASRHHAGAQQSKTESTPSPRGTKSILPSTLKTTLSNGEQLALTLLAVR